MFCIQCGQQLDADAKFCFSCGAGIEAEDNLQSSTEAIPPPVSESVAAAPKPTPPKPIAIPAEAPTPVQATQPQPRVHTVPPNEPDVNETGRGRGIFVAIALVALLAVVAVAGFFLLRRNGEAGRPTPSGTYEAATQTPDPAIQYEVSLYHIERVFNGILPAYPGVVIGPAFSQYFNNYTWTHFVSENINYVSFFGEMPQEGADPTAVQILFRFTAGDTEFNASRLFLNTLYQESATLNGLLETVLG